MKITRTSAVLKAMTDGRWHTLAELRKKTGYPEASISAQLRDFRKPQFGGFTILKRFIGDAYCHTFEYLLNA